MEQKRKQFIFILWEKHCLFSSGTFRRRLATILRRKLRFLLPENWRRSASGKSQVASSANSSLRQRHAIAIGGAATPVPAKHHQINNNPAVFLANKDRKFSLADF
jgi:hypothetical protein